MGALQRSLHRNLRAANKDSHGESEREGVLPGDVILSVNGTVLTGLTQDAVLTKLQRAPRPMQIIFARQAAAELVQHDADHGSVKKVRFARENSAHRPFCHLFVFTLCHSPTGLLPTLLFQLVTGHFCRGQARARFLEGSN